MRSSNAKPNPTTISPPYSLLPPRGWKSAEWKQALKVITGNMLGPKPLGRPS